MYACRYGNSQLLRILHEAGFTIDSNTIQNLLHLTLYSGTTDIIKDLLRRVEVSEVYITNMLRYSATLGKRDMAFFHMINGAMVRLGDSPNVTFVNIYPKENSLFSVDNDTKIFDPSNDYGNSLPFLEISDSKRKEKSNAYFAVVTELARLGKRYKFDLILEVLSKEKQQFSKLPRRDVFSFLQEKGSLASGVRDYLSN